MKLFTIFVNGASIDAMKTNRQRLIFPVFSQGTCLSVDPSAVRIGKNKLF
jgi:hypothetical protein